MTTSKSSQAKPVPDFFIFEPAEGGGKNKFVGFIFLHENGKGQTLLLNGKRYVALEAMEKRLTRGSTLNGLEFLQYLHERARPYQKAQQGEGA